MILGEIDYFMFGANIWLLVGILLLGVVAIGVLIAAWTGVNIIVWKLRTRKAQTDYRRERFRPDGTPYPPSARGICERCKTVYPRVYYVESVGRLCPEHFEEWDRRRSRPETAAPGAK
jgi:hypothetical protein